MRKKFNGDRVQSGEEGNKVDWELEEFHHSYRKEEEHSEEAEKGQWKDREPDEVGRGHRRRFHQKVAGDIVKCHREVTWKNKGETSGCGQRV